jgi:hypothetical protein
MTDPPAWSNQLIIVPAIKNVPVKANQKTMSALIFALFGFCRSWNREGFRWRAMAILRNDTPPDAMAVQSTAIAPLSGDLREVERKAKME